MKPKGRLVLLLVSLLVLLSAAAGYAENRLLAPDINAMGPSPARLMVRFSPGERIFYSLDGTYPTMAYDPAQPPLLYDTTVVRVVAKRDGYADSDVVSKKITVRHVLYLGGSPSQLTSKGNNYTLTLRKVIGNGRGIDDNTQVKLAIGYTGTVAKDWSGKVGDFQLTNKMVTGNIATLTFGDGQTTLFSQQGPNPTGIYAFDIKIGQIDLIVYVPYTYLPQWTNASP